AHIRQASQALAPPREEDPLEAQRELEREAAECAQETRRAARQARKTVREQVKEARATQRRDQYQQVLELREQGLSSEEIAPRVGISARTVRQWEADGVETRPRRRRPSPLDRFAAYLRHRWEEGEQHGERLYAELQAKGYTGSMRALYRYVNRWRPPQAQEEPPLPSKRRGKRSKKTAPLPGPFDDCQAKQAVWLYVRSPEALTRRRTRTTHLPSASSSDA
ncbi:MAG: helix-turn-helix domain-containing protein, partial [Candidatus Dormibacteraceae bacterium]